MRKVTVKTWLWDWFATLPHSVTSTYDSLHDRDLLTDALDGEWTKNLSERFGLRPLINSRGFDVAVTQHHTKERPRAPCLVRRASP